MTDVFCKDTIRFWNSRAFCYLWCRNDTFISRNVLSHWPRLGFETVPLFVTFGVVTTRLLAVTFCRIGRDWVLERFRFLLPLQMIAAACGRTKEL